MSERVLVWATHRFAGFHEWPGATIERAYLAFPHRHLFHVRVEVDVLHDDREVEFHDLYDVIVAWSRDAVEAGPMSCEMLARACMGRVVAAFGDRAISVEVSEDGEFGAKVLSGPE